MPEGESRFHSDRVTVPWNSALGVAFGGGGGSDARRRLQLDQQTRARDMAERRLPQRTRQGPL